jgi:hypothetical protein
MGTTWLSPWESEQEETLLHYTLVTGATASVVTSIRNTLHTGYGGTDWLTAYRGQRDPYRAHINAYVWGSNATKAAQGILFRDIITYSLDSAWNSEARKAAENYLHYLHGTNPLGLVYLSNMNAHGADSSVNEFFHSWFVHGSPLWDRVGVSTYGPAPGYLTGGPNPGYSIDACCSASPRSCGSTANNALCDSESVSPPNGQPPQKSYKDFNTAWPLNSWSVTEPSCGYQPPYVRLLSWFVR